MKEPASAPSEREDGNIVFPRWTPIVLGTVIFVGFAITDPVFGNLLLDIPLYLALGLGGIVVFFLTFLPISAMIGVEKIMRGNERFTAVGWAVAVLAFTVAGGSILAAAHLLQSAF